LKKKTDKFSRTSTIHPGIFLGRALWADSVSSVMNIIASRHQFKPIRITGNLVVDYKKNKTKQQQQQQNTIV